MMKKYLVVAVGLIFFSACSYEYAVIKKEAYSIEVNSDFEANEESEKIISPYRLKLGDSMSSVLCVSELPMSKKRPESELGNLIADLSLEIGNEFCKKHGIDTIDFCLLNSGGLRASLPKGNITTGNVFELMPFENELVVVALSSDGVIELIKYLKQSGGEPIAGLRVSFKGEFYTARINNKPIETNKIYRVLTTDYLANGGDKMTFLQKENRESIESVGIKMRDAIHLYFQRQGEQNKTIKGLIDGRLQFEE